MQHVLSLVVSEQDLPWNGIVKKGDREEKIASGGGGGLYGNGNGLPGLCSPTSLGVIIQIPGMLS